MKLANPIVRMVILLLGLLMSIGCLGISVDDLKATHVPPAAAETLTSIAATQTAQVTPTDTPSQKVALVSFHGRYVTALGESDDWALKQELELSECGWFTQYHLDNDKVALVTCHGRYITAPRRGTTRWDWELWQESGLGDCGQFVLRDLGSDEVAFETCTGNFFTAGDGGWESGLQWSVVAETDKIEAWERFTILPEP
jgi:hypothetical protein